MPLVPKIMTFTRLVNHRIFIQLVQVSRDLLQCAYNRTLILGTFIHYAHRIIPDTSDKTGGISHMT